MILIQGREQKLSTLLNSFENLYESFIPVYKVHLESVDVSSRVHVHLSEYSFELHHHIITHAKSIESSSWTVQHHRLK